MCVCESISNYCIHVIYKYHKSILLWTYKLHNSNWHITPEFLELMIGHLLWIYSLKQEAIWPTYLEGWILLFSRSSLLLFILIFHNLAAIWLNSTRISVILIYNAGFYILLAMINSCRVFSISFLCMSQKWVCFNQSEVHLQSFNLKLICMVSAYLKFIFKASISDVHSQIKLQSEVHLHFRASFCS